MLLLIIRKRGDYMTEVYACLLGDWTNLSNSNNLRIDNSHDDANLWWEEVGHKLFDYDYINITHDDVNYRIHPSFIQIITR